ncbi:hypothetical protein [Vibrio rotiferianus]|uniref:hypothetical protein n=1 Tax=Vibrio rotiferianus TaxID=190895 RepID=UPI00057607C2|nr:hypothetical protein [Vibrio rotiferianus]PIB17221.1 hypothetical protein B853_07362 [Vibrio rotiferianus CAIM 577 = LMG 21460]
MTSRNKSSSSSQTTNNNATGQVTNAGDNLGVNVAGVNGNVRVSMSDHGSVNRSFDFAEESLKLLADGAFGLGEKSVESANKSLTDSLKFGEGVVDESLGLVGDVAKQNSELADKAIAETRRANKDALDAAMDAQKEALSFGNDALRANNDALKQSMAFGNDALKSNADALRKSMDFGNDALDSNSKVTEQALENMRRNSTDTVEMAKNMAMQSATTTKDVIALSEKMNATAEKTVSQSQTGSSDSIAKVAMVSAIAFGVAAAVRG